VPHCPVVVGSLSTVLKAIIYVSIRPCYCNTLAARRYRTHCFTATVLYLLSVCCDEHTRNCLPGRASWRKKLPVSMFSCAVCLCLSPVLLPSVRQKKSSLLIQASTNKACFFYETHETIATFAHVVVTSTLHFAFPRDQRSVASDPSKAQYCSRKQQPFTFRGNSWKTASYLDYDSTWTLLPLTLKVIAIIARISSQYLGDVDNITSFPFDEVHDWTLYAAWSRPISSEISWINKLSSYFSAVLLNCNYFHTPF